MKSEIKWTVLLLGLSCFSLEAKPLLNYFTGKNCVPEEPPPLVEDCPCLPKSRGSVSFNYTVGYGRIEVTEDKLISSAFLEPVIEDLFNTRKRSGGVTMRGFMTGLYDVSDHISLGADIGFTSYPDSKYSQNFTLSLAALGLDAGFILKNSVQSRGYGADLLLNLTIYCIPEFFFAIKPGFQLARQKNILKGAFDIGLTPAIGPNIGIPSTGKYRNTQFLPQIMLSAGWNIQLGHCARLDLRKYAITLEMDYQHVFGQDDAPVTKRINSRDMVGLTVGLRF